ncbi:hypothetical protein OF829_04160 [Sphingomonas sp. LB-2]|uniref:hypothetical protein n=1 Tax=Sphingomonas caeni TaxID=2984949 RepID=UPI0022317F87|nr:hypothetical protein [Sphingomonas caeni]MCW3846421.1 hypothetical protein [Sphingomonas caeni]
MRSALLLLAALPLAACTGDDCADTVAARALSPDGKREAVLFDRNCGATTGFSTQISVLPAGAAPSGTGNAFIADSAPAASWGGPWAEMRWLGPDRLEIRYDSRADVFLKARVVSGVQVEFRATDPPPGAVAP